MSTKCVTREVTTYYARPPCFPSGYESDGKCYGSTAVTECGVMLSDLNREKLATVAKVSGFPDVLSEEDAFRFLCAESVAEHEIASRTGVYDFIVNLIFGREDMEETIRDNELFKARYHFDHFYRKGRYDNMDLNAIRYRARQFVEQAQTLAEKPAEKPIDCNGVPFGTNVHCDHTCFGITLFEEGASRYIGGVCNK